MPDKPTCRGCGQLIEWVKTKAGKSMPLNPKKITVVTEDGEAISGKTSHFATCPNANEFRKKK